MKEHTSILVNGKSFEVEVLEREPNYVRFAVQGRDYKVQIQEVVEDLAELRDSNSDVISQSRSKGLKRNSTGSVVSPMPGVVLSIHVNKGDVVRAGQLLMRIEAMKMENNIFAPHSGAIQQIKVAVGDEVKSGDLLMLLS